MRTRIEFDTEAEAFEHQAKKGGSVVKLTEGGNIFWYDEGYYDDDINVDLCWAWTFIYSPSREGRQKMKDGSGQEIDRIISTTSMAMKQGRRGAWGIMAAYVVVGGKVVEGPIFFKTKKAADAVIRSVRKGL